MRVLIEGTGAPLGAAGHTRLTELARALPELRPQHHFVFVVRSQVAPTIRELAPSVSLWTLPAALGHTTLRQAWLRAVFPVKARRFRPHVVFAPFNVAPAVLARPRPALALMVSNLAPYSDVALSRSRGRELWRNRVLRRATDRSIRRADCVFIQSRQTFELIPIAGLRDKAMFIPPPAPPSPPDIDGSAMSPHDPYIVVVGDLHSHKGVETAIEAIARLDSPPPLLVCGHKRDPAYVNSLEGLATRRGVSERVRLIGSMPHDDVLALMRDAIACVATSRFENYTRIPGEAMSVGTPVIARDIPAYREACGDAAVYYDDGRALADRLRSVIENPRLGEELGRGGLELLSSRGSSTAPEVIVRALERLAGDRAQR